MLNFGLTEMRLVAPRDGWPNPDAGPAASGADIVLEKAQVYSKRPRKRSPIAAWSLPRPSAAAIWSCRWSGRRKWRRRSIRPAAGPAILFGPERSGLETEDVAVASRIVTVPINPEFGSLNLAQAVILLAYEWSRGSGARAADQPRKWSRRRPWASWKG